MKIKKAIFILAFIMSVVLGTQIANAASYDLSATSTDVNVGDKVTIKATFTAAAWNINVSGNGISGGSYASQTDDLSEKTTTKSFDLDTSKEGSYTIKMSGDITSESGTTTNVNKSITVKVNKKSSTTSSNSNQGTSTNTNTGTNKQTTETKKSTEARLSNFGIKPNDFSGFKRDNTEYSTEVPNDVSEVTVYATAVDSKAKVTGTGKVSLKEGDNKVSVTVTAEAGNTQTYTLTIKRKTTAEDTTNTATTTENDEKINTSDAFGLSSLDIDDVKLNPEFDTETYEYTVDLDKDLTSLEISAIATDDDTTVEIAGNEDLKDGENLITIIVQNKKTKETATYQITVNKNVAATSTEENSDQVEEMNWLKPSTWGKEEIIKVAIMAVLVILIVIAIILKVKLVKEKKSEKDIDFPGADELDKALAEHQELSDWEETNSEEENNVTDINNFGGISDITYENSLDKVEDSKENIENVESVENNKKDESFVQDDDIFGKKYNNTNYLEEIARSKNYNIDYEEDFDRKTKKKGKGKHF